MIGAGDLAISYNFYPSSQELCISGWVLQCQTPSLDGLLSCCRWMITVVAVLIGWLKHIAKYRRHGHGSCEHGWGTTSVGQQSLVAIALSNCHSSDC